MGWRNWQENTRPFCMYPILTFWYFDILILILIYIIYIYINYIIYFIYFDNFTPLFSSYIFTCHVNINHYLFLLNICKNNKFRIYVLNLFIE